MKAPVLASLLLSCAAAKPVPVKVAQQHWTPHIRATVQLSCEAHLGVGKLCDCLTEKLEVISPDTKTDFTREDLRAGLSACRSMVEPTGGEAL